MKTNQATSGSATANQVPVRSAGVRSVRRKATQRPVRIRPRAQGVPATNGQRPATGTPACDDLLGRSRNSTLVTVMVSIAGCMTLSTEPEAQGHPRSRVCSLPHPDHPQGHRARRCSAPRLPASWGCLRRRQELAQSPGEPYTPRPLLSCSPGRVSATIGLTPAATDLHLVGGLEGSPVTRPHGHQHPALGSGLDPTHKESAVQGELRSRRVVALRLRDVTVSNHGINAVKTAIEEGRKTPTRPG
jgi:hypothetical protein